MRASSRNHFLCRIALALILGAALLAPAQRAEAQGLFNFFNQLFGGALRPSEPPKPALPATAYCVRLCDGRYFPLSQSARGQASPANLCSALCPASDMRVYSGSGIDEATAADGAPYSTLKTAFLYREQIVADCTCNGRDPAGVAPMDAFSDPTLKPGDIVVTREGPRVFSGREDGPRRAADFLRPEQARGLPANVRATLASIRLTPELNRAEEDFAVAAAPLPPPRPGEAQRGPFAAWARMSEVYTPYPP